MKIKKMLISGTMVLFLSMSGTAYANERDFIRIEDKKDSSGTTYDYVLSGSDTYTTSDESQYDFGFVETVEMDGTSYKLDHIEYEKINKYEAEFGGNEIEYEINKEVIVEDADKESYKPDTKTINQNGYVYNYKGVVFKESDNKKPVTMNSYITTEILAEINLENYPAEMSYEYKGQNYTLAYKDYTVISDGWFDYDLKGTIIDYDAATYLVGDSVVLHDDNNINMSAEELASFLASQGYSSEIYKPVSIEYSGEPYTNAEGNLCRDYLIIGQRYGKIYQINYEDTYDIPQYTAVLTYAISDTDKAEIESMKSSYEVTAYAFYNLDNSEPEQKEIKKNTLSLPEKVAIGIGVILAIIAIITLIVYLVRGGRKRTEYMSKREAKDEFKNM